ncbi:MAG: hypothetical protein K9M80_02690 [Candidatus Marinimicrobia bacterium]|nr:hypothetical protein [Candidatus Neomarinimicrobiota bacterium]
MQKFIKIVLFLLSLLFIFNCSRKEPEIPDFEENILVKIGDKDISVQEFIRRAEYTPRPNYCRLNFPIHKKIVLNSLVAEKLLALEAGSNPEILEDESISSFLQGKKEQAMRKILKYEVGHDQVKQIVTTKVLKMARYLDNTYKVKYVNIPDKKALKNIEKKLKKNRSLEKVIKDIYEVDSLQTRNIKWHEYENDAIMSSLYTKTYDKDDIVGPIKWGNDNYLYMQILEGEERVINSDQRLRQNYSRTNEYLTRNKASQYYTNYVRDLMMNKSIEFVEETFYKVVDKLGPIYFKTDRSRRERLKNTLWGVGNVELQVDSSLSKMDNLKNKPFFTIDGNVWTVGDFTEYRRKHPLVFRNKRMQPEEFAENFKQAVIDMVTNYYLTEEAHEKNYDKVDIVQRNNNMWKDNIKSYYQLHKFISKNGLDSLYNADQMKTIKEYLNPYIDSLQKKYSEQIYFNKEAFESIELNRKPMAVYEPNVPWPGVVPKFPALTTEHSLDYGQLME